jgi:hypothetical protein
LGHEWNAAVTGGTCGLLKKDVSPKHWYEYTEQCETSKDDNVRNLHRLEQSRLHKLFSVQDISYQNLNTILTWTSDINSAAVSTDIACAPLLHFMQ